MPIHSTATTTTTAGRERHANHRDDMDGVGSFNNPSRTLYVGGIMVRPYIDRLGNESGFRG